MTNSASGAADEASPGTGPSAIIAGHAGFAEGLAGAVRQITGEGGVFVCLSNTGLGPEEILSRFAEAASSHGIRVFFTDLPGGSATFAVRKLMKTDPSIVLVTGANLPAVLEFVFRREGDPVEAARLSAEKGRSALVVYESN